MNDRDKIRAYVRARLNDALDALEEFERTGAKEAAGQSRCTCGNFASILSFIDKLPSEPYSDNIEQEVINYTNRHKEECYGRKVLVYDVARHFAAWQLEQFERNRLAACDAQTEEEEEIERNYVSEIIEQEHRQPTFNDAIKYGMRLQGEQKSQNSWRPTEEQLEALNEAIYHVDDVVATSLAKLIGDLKKL